MKRETYLEFVVETEYAPEGWTICTFYLGGQAAGHIRLRIEQDDESYIFNMATYPSRRGTGTHIIRFLAERLQVTHIGGDALPDSIDFWNTFDPEWTDDSFAIVLPQPAAEQAPPLS